MKKTSKLLTLLVVLSLVFSFVCLPLSAVDVEQGKTHNATVVFDGVAGVDGKISYSNPDMFTGVSAKISTNATGEATKDAFLLYTDDAQKDRISFVLTFKVSGKAKVNESCAVVITYNTYDENGNAIAKNLIKTINIKAVEASNNIDYSVLNEEIALAEILVEKDYTAESWTVLANALANAKNAKNSNNQSVVDSAAAALAAARLALVKLDYSSLISALAEVDAFYATDDTTSLLKQFVEAVMLGNDLLENGGSQDEIDATAAKILELLDALKKALEDMGDEQIVYVEVPVAGETETVIVTETVQVEVEVPVQNNLWLVLFIITAILLVAAVAFLVVKYLQERGTGAY